MTPRERALQLLGTMSDSNVLTKLAEEGWIVQLETVRQWRKKAGIPQWAAKVRTEDLDRCVAAYKEHGSLKAASRALRMDHRTLATRLKLAGVLPAQGATK